MRLDGSTSRPAPPALLLAIPFLFLRFNTRASPPSFSVLLVLCVLVCVVPSFADNEKQSEAYEGKFKEVMDALDANDVEGAAKLAQDWVGSSSGRTEILALVALGEVEERRGSLTNLRKAARVYGSCMYLSNNLIFILVSDWLRHLGSHRFVDRFFPEARRHAPFRWRAHGEGRALPSSFGHD